jgi:hypothetical protein
LAISATVSGNPLNITGRRKFIGGMLLKIFSIKLPSF